MANTNKMFGYRKTNKVILGTTRGWDGKDYEGEGRLWPVWKKENDDTTYTRIYNRKYKCWCFMMLTSRLSEKGVQIFELAEYFERN